MGFSRQEHWSGFSRPPPGDLSDPGIEPATPASPTLQVDCYPLYYQGSPHIIFKKQTRKAIYLQVGKSSLNWEKILFAGKSMSEEEINIYETPVLWPPHAKS